MCDVGSDSSGCVVGDGVGGDGVGGDSSRREKLRAQRTLTFFLEY